MFYKIYIYISLFVLSANLLIASPMQKVDAERGVLDISDVSGHSKFKVSLTGEWEFFPQQFINLSEYIGKKDIHSVFKHVPQTWGKEDMFDNEKFGTGYGTYHLAIVNRNEANKFGLILNDIYSAYKVFIGEKLVLKCGEVGSDAASSIPCKRSNYCYFEADQDTVHLFIQVSNFHHRIGGFDKIPILGNAKTIENSESINMFNDMFNVSILLVSGFIFLILFLYRRKNYSYLFFALFCLFAFFRIIVISEVLIASLYEVSFFTVMRIEYVSFYLLIPSILLYIYHLYPIKYARKPMFALSMFYTFLAILSLFIPMYYLSWVVQYSKILLVITIVYCSIYIVLIIKRRDNFVLILVISLVQILFFSLVEILFSVYFSHITTYMFHVSIFVFVVIQIFLLIRKYSANQNELEKLAQDLKNVNENLEQIVSERTKNLNEQKQILEKQSKSLQTIVNTKNKLFSIIGHDLRSPIGIANMYSEHLLKEGSFSIEQKSMLKYIENSSTSALHLLNNLLMWGKSETGKIIYNPIYFDLEELIIESSNQFNGAISAKKISLKIQTDSQIIFADRFMILLVLNNLISNAIKFSNPGGNIDINVKTIGDTENNAVVILIQDSGVGMSDEVLDKVLNSDDYVTSRGTSNEKGSGLGLKICKDFVGQNNGDLSIFTEQDSGTKVEIKIPVKRWA